MDGYACVHACLLAGSAQTGQNALLSVHKPGCLWEVAVSEPAGSHSKSDGTMGDAAQ